jgi:hypothetical protein
MRIFALGHELAIAFTEPHLGLPADSLERGGSLSRRRGRWRLTLAG